jgi:hypothetical protein
MNLILVRVLASRFWARRTKIGFAVAILTFLFVMVWSGPGLVAQSTGDSAAAFKRLAVQLSAARLKGTEESETQQGKALSLLDSMVSSFLSSSASPDLGSANQRLASLVSHDPPVGENYRLVRLGGKVGVYALAVNFGLGGPAAVRIYAAENGHIGLAARIDHYSQKDFFDSDITLVPVSTAEAVFVVVSGRTDDLATGLFSAWRFEGSRVAPLWSSDLLAHSSYEANADGFHLTYCSQPDDDHPTQCPRMSRDLYRFQDSVWKRVATTDLGPLPGRKD